MTKVAQTTWNRDVWGIASPSGNPWTDQVFCSEDDANGYLKKCGRANKTWDLTRHMVVPVSVTVRVIKPKKS